MTEVPADRRRGRKLLRSGLTVVVLLVVGWFFAQVLLANWSAVAAIDVSFDGWSVLAMLLFAGAVPLSGLIWGRMTALLSGTSVPVLEAVRVQCASWLLKYVPGQLGSAVNKVVWGGRRGIPRSLMVITFVYENAFLLIGSVVPALAVLAVTTAGQGVAAGSRDVWLAVVAALVLMALVGDPRVFRAVAGVLGSRVLKRELPQEHFLGAAAAARYQLAFLGPRLLNAAGFVCVALSTVPVPARLFLPLGAIYVLAGAVGILAVFVPSGLGVRESVIVVFAAIVMPVEQAVLLSLLARLYSTAADVLVAVGYAALSAAHRRGRVAT